MNMWTPWSLSTKCDWSHKIITYFEALGNDGGFKIKYIVAIHQWSTAKHTKFSLIPYLQDNPLYKNQAAKIPAILDSFYLELD